MLLRMAERRYTRHDLEVDQAMATAEVHDRTLPPSDAEVGVPEWIILGSRRTDDGVAVYASRSLAAAHFTAYMGKVERNLAANPTPWRDEPDVRTYRIAALAGDIWEARGVDYADAIGKLFRHWNPEGGATGPLELPS